jgi:two-component system sensor histidine kinase SenX3
VLRAAALDGEPHSRTVDLFGPPRRNLQIGAVPLSDGTRSVGGVAVIEDVSDRKRLEAVRRDFVANVSHELKTPVGALGLLAETLADEEDAAVIRRLARRMQAEAMRVGRTIHDLLDLSRLESEESPEREPVAVHLAVGQAVEQVRGAAEARGVVLEVADIGRRITVPGDRRQLVSAVYNLLDNAVKYSEPASSVHLRCATNGDWVELSVQDHGIGIPTRDYERIFERFYRVDRARSRETGGTGLGLAIVRHVATNHGGRISVTSREGEGSTFFLRLPAGPGPVAVSGWTDAEAG